MAERDSFREFMELRIPGSYGSRRGPTPESNEYVLENFGLRRTMKGREVSEEEMSEIVEDFYLEELGASKDPRMELYSAFVLPDGRREGVNYSCYGTRFAEISPEGFQVKISVLDLTEALRGEE